MVKYKLTLCNVIVAWIKKSPQPTTLIVDKERQTRLRLIKHFVPKFNQISKKDTVNIIKGGLNKESDFFLQLKTTLTKAS